MAFQPPTYERSDRSMSSTVVREFQPPMDSMHLRRLRSQGGGQAHVTEIAYRPCFNCVFQMWFVLLLKPLTADGALECGGMCMEHKQECNSAPDAGGAVEVEEAAGAEVHPLLALAVVVQAELLRLQMCAPTNCQSMSS